MTDGQGYRVVPQALRSTQQSFEDTANKWNDLGQKTMPSWKMGDGDLGLLGRQAGIVQDYNNAVSTIIEKTKAGHDNFQVASDNLDTVAKAYEAQDEEYYRKFGWMNQNMDHVAPPPRPGRS